MEKVKLKLAVSDCFLDAVMKKFHFSPEERESFFAVGRKLEAALEEEAGFWYSAYPGHADLVTVVMTLGAGVDELQERYTKEGCLTECYMAEAIADELLLLAYRRFNRWVEEQGSRHVARYYFFGAADGRREAAGAGESPAAAAGSGLICAPTLEEIPGALASVGETQVRCNQACCLTPKKSVIFLAELTREAVRCEGICMGCQRADCPNRYEKEREDDRLRWPDLTDRALPYGYARIMGR